MKPRPPDLPTNIVLKWIYYDALTDQVDQDPHPGEAWGVWLHDQQGKEVRVGVVHNGKTRYRLESLVDRPHREACMVNGEQGSPEYANRNAAVMGLLDLYFGRDPSQWHVVPEDRISTRRRIKSKSKNEDEHKPKSENEDEHKPKSENEDEHKPKSENEDERKTKSENEDERKTKSENEDERKNAILYQCRDDNMEVRVPNSASQIKKYTSCIRLWGWEYLERLKLPPGAAAVLGNRCHKVLENWLAEGVTPDPTTREGKIVIPGLVHLPTPNPQLETEREFLFDLRGHLYRGFVDLGYWTEDGVWVVHDHKTTSDFMWALEEEDLLHDVQAILYAKEALDRHKIDRLILSWLYMRTKGKPKAETRRITIERSAVESGMQIIEQYTHHMAELREEYLPIVRERPHQPGEDSVVLTLEPNAYACSAYGGCPFADRCKLSSRDKMRSIMAQDGKKQSLREKMGARKAGRSGDVVAATPVVKVAKAPAVEAPAVEAPAVEAPAVVAPAINPPEQPSEAVQLQLLTAEEKQAVDKDKKGKAAEKKGRGRPKGATKKAEAVLGAHEAVFAQIWCAALAGGAEDRHMAAAERVWIQYKQEFMSDG